MPANDVYELALQSSLDSQRFVNVFHFRQSGEDPASGTAEEALFNAFQYTLIPLLVACCSNEFHFTGAIVRRVWPTGLPGVPFYHSYPGTLDEPSLPPETTVVVGFTSAIHTRKGRGRKFIPGVPISFTDHGRLTDTAEALYAAFGSAAWQTMIGGTGLPDWVPGVWNKPTVLFSAWTGAVVRTIVKTLRSRTKYEETF